MKFDFDKYRGKYAVHCKTEEEAKDFYRVMRDSGRKWCTGENYIESTDWYTYGTETCYDFNEGTFRDVGFFESIDYQILEWSDFMEKEFTKSDLKEGMVGITREGERYVFLCGKFRNCNGMSSWGADHHLNNDFTSAGGHDSLDFMRICITSAETLCNWCDDEYLTPLWERNEVTEMTMYEIKDRLGISGELKIVE